MKNILEKIEKLSESESNTLVGGFSMAYSTDASTESFMANNCKSGNCKSGCKNKSKEKSKDKSKGNAPNSNCKAGGNCVKGCGG